MSRLTKADKQALAEAKSETDKIVSLADEKVKEDSLNTMNETDCRNQTHGAYDDWEALRKVQEKEARE